MAQAEQYVRGHGLHAIIQGTSQNAQAVEEKLRACRQFVPTAPDEKRTRLARIRDGSWPATITPTSVAGEPVGRGLAGGLLLNEFRSNPSC
ncbi:hypothetical protein [Streptomyces dangxiongensis]|uniref:hypothetical protein n=1 Tax=Streptomyces dangxiongensis TaxID=1442032 RepID=UPI001F0995FB|nr:hypothetical protein [Streptomyces dangxiongensis]